LQLQERQEESRRQLAIEESLQNLKSRIKQWKQLKFSQKMTGTAEIITDDIRLLERFLNPLKSIWKKNIE